MWKWIAIGLTVALGLCLGLWHLWPLLNEAEKRAFVQSTIEKTITGIGLLLISSFLTFQLEKSKQRLTLDSQIINQLGSTVDDLIKTCMTLTVDISKLQAHIDESEEGQTDWIDKYEALLPLKIELGSKFVTNRLYLTNDIFHKYEDLVDIIMTKRSSTMKELVERLELIHEKLSDCLRELIIFRQVIHPKYISKLRNMYRAHESRILKDLIYN